MFFEYFDQTNLQFLEMNSITVCLYRLFFVKQSFIRFPKQYLIKKSLPKILKRQNTKFLKEYLTEKAMQEAKILN